MDDTPEEEPRPVFIAGGVNDFIVFQNHIAIDQPGIEIENVAFICQDNVFG